MSIKSEILDIAQDHGYTGSAQTITGAINALTDTLAGSDVQGGRTVASAIHALGPYIGSGGGGESTATCGVRVLDANSSYAGMQGMFMCHTESGSIRALGNLITGYQLSCAVPSGIACMVMPTNRTDVYAVKFRAASSSTAVDIDYSVVQGGIEFTVPAIDDDASAYDASGFPTNFVIVTYGIPDDGE